MAGPRSTAQSIHGSAYGATSIHFLPNDDPLSTSDPAYELHRYDRGLRAKFRRIRRVDSEFIANTTLIHLVDDSRGV